MPRDRKRVPHHLIDVLDPHEDFSVAEYLTEAATICAAVLERNRTPLFVGGTGLYLRSVLRGVFAGPEADWNYRQHLEALATQHGPECLHKLLIERDPAAAATLHPNDRRRIIRALEVEHVTGRPLSEQQQQPPLSADQRPPNVYWLSPARDWLHERINRRVHEMIDRGLVDEVQSLLKTDPPPGRTARQALGYKEVIEHLENGTSLEETIATVQTRTRQFAKRQCTWFRNLEECRAVEITGKESPADIAIRLLQAND